MKQFQAALPEDDAKANQTAYIAMQLSPSCANLKNEKMTQPAKVRYTWNANGFSQSVSKSVVKHAIPLLRLITRVNV